jgi:hypothetical protein
MFTSEPHVPMMRSSLIKTFFKNFVTFSLGATKRCRVLTPISLCMKLRPTRMLNLSRQRLHPVHPRKAAAIKLEVEKLLKADFIYPVALTDWVSNLVLVNKKQGTIRVCVDYRDINKSCPKDNYPTPFVDQIVDDCVRSEIFSLMDGFSGYNQINIFPMDQHKTAFICPWGTFAYQKLPFGLKNVGATFQRAMSYDFHDIKHIVQPYLDDLPSAFHASPRSPGPSPSHFPSLSLLSYTFEPTQMCFLCGVWPTSRFYCVTSWN